MTERFTPSPDNCTVDGHKFRGHLAWDQLDWTRAEWREKASLMVVVCGYEGAPDDPHWSVPHIDGDTHHRVRLKRNRRAPLPAITQPR